MPTLKKYWTILLTVILSIVLLNYILGYWIEARLQQLLNGTERKSYKISYNGIDLHNFFNGATIESLEIIPMEDSIQEVPVRIFGSAERVEISGLHWIRLLANRSLQVNSIIFDRPEFRVYISNDSTQRSQTGKSIQELFREVLNGAEVREFKLASGNASFMKLNDSDTIQVARIGHVDIEAFNIETDTLLLTYIIPFKLERINTMLSGIRYNVNDYSVMTIENASYDSDSNVLSFNNASLKLNEEWIDVSQKLGFQTDLFEFDLKSLSINNLRAKSTLYDSLDIEAATIHFDSMILRDYRNKNIPRPQENIKPLFAGMVHLIPFPLKVDSVVVSNSTISYTELDVNKDAPGTITFNNVESVFKGISTYPEAKRNYDRIEVSASGNINGDTRLQLDLLVPYNGDRFYADATFTDMDARVLNKTIRNLAGIAINSGDISAFHFTMDANPINSKNTLILDYKNLELALLVENKESELKRLGFLSGLFNSAIRQNNMPSEKGYQSAEYISTRNQERGPFNFMWQGIKDGMVYIIPSDAAALLINQKKK